MCEYDMEWVQKKCSKCSRVEYSIRSFDKVTYIVCKCGICEHVEEFPLSVSESGDEDN